MELETSVLLLGERSAYADLARVRWLHLKESCPVAGSSVLLAQHILA